MFLHPVQNKSVSSALQYAIFCEFIGLLQVQQLHNYEFNMNLDEFPTYNYKRPLITS